MKFPAQIDLIASDFDGTFYVDQHNCALSNAVRRYFPMATHISEHVHYIEIKPKWWSFRQVHYHESYYPRMFDDDLIAARSHEFDGTVIRTIKFN